MNKQEMEKWAKDVIRDFPGEEIELQLSNSLEAVSAFSSYAEMMQELIFKFFNKRMAKEIAAIIILATDAAFMHKYDPEFAESVGM